MYISGDTEIWMHNREYRRIDSLYSSRRKTNKAVLVESFDDYENDFNYDEGMPVKVLANIGFVEVTFSGVYDKLRADGVGTIKCSPDQEFMVTDNPNIDVNVRSFPRYFMKASELKPGTRLVAKDIVVNVISVKKLKDEEFGYTLQMEDTENYPSNFGIILKGLKG